MACYIGLWYRPLNAMYVCGTIPSQRWIYVTKETPEDLNTAAEDLNKALEDL